MSLNSYSLHDLLNIFNTFIFIKPFIKHNCNIRLLSKAFRLSAAIPNPCPPMVVGVGIGGTFDKCALLAKKALMRPLDTQNPDPFYADLEKEMLEKVNKLGIGPQGFGGKTTAIGLNIETMPTHIAGMPCAVNINCHVTRHKSEVI